MFMTDVNEVKIYNLSAGKSLPEVSTNKFFGMRIYSMGLFFHRISVVERSKATKVA